MAFSSEGSTPGSPPRAGSRMRRLIGRVAGSLGVLALFAGMLFWTKLRLMTDVPRSAYAVPDATEPDATQPDATELESNEPDAAEPDAAEPADRAEDASADAAKDE